MSEFLSQWQQAAHTTLGLFWMAFWAFGLGYLISSCIQIFVTQERMQKSMGTAGPKSVALGTFFGFISSSCSFAALSTTRALFTKGAGLVPSLAFLLSSTNLVVELGIVIAIFLGWQFVVGEYIGGLLLIAVVWFLVKMIYPRRMIEKGREQAQQAEGHHHHGGGSEGSWKEKLASREAWRQVGQQYFMEWQMVWKDVSIGFTVAGIIAVFVPTQFFHALFLGAGQENPHFFEVLAQTVVGPVAAFFTFIGSMGNIPLAAVLFGQGVSFAGVMAFIFSDLVVLPVLRIQAQFYGWKMALYILGLFLVALVSTALILHYGFALFDLLPEGGQQKSVSEREFFKVDYTFFLNVLFLIASGVAVYLHLKGRSSGHGGGGSLSDKILFTLTMVAYVWLAAGVAVIPFVT